ncbi:Nramp family divalent metal transporter [Bryobacter aggregatus]|uniref:Nramp family divalent metal transporter n=1 Tax=Bryobacter aggregatus TaxID=360054 RepID=UPI0006895598|nr:Nramp family divalent metal transporter [Bryobacter aggregatus]
MLKDPYQYHPEDVAEPPIGFWNILRRIGPGMILAASIVGSGELIATTTLGAEVGFAALWIIVISCLIKPAVQAELGRYSIATGQTGLAGLNEVPGPRWKVNWIVWGWVVMVAMTRFQIGAMFGGVALTMHAIVPAISITAWIFILLAITLALLLGGGYERIEGLATLKVCLFTMLTLLCAILLTRRSDIFHWSEVWQGFEFQLPGSGLATAVAVFGITGVGASELFMYPYWCVEKGYARYTGPRDGTPAWKHRAHGWLRVMNVDILATMVIYTVATAAFYLLGAGILHKLHLVPKSNETISVLSRMYTETLGEWALPLFYIGAIATLYGTIFAATAADSRVSADLCRLMGAFQSEDYAARIRYRNGFVWVLTIVPVILVLIFQEPVAMVKAGGVAQALMLPVISIGALYLHRKKMPEAAKAGPLMSLSLWIATITIVAAIGYYAIRTFLG